MTWKFRVLFLDEHYYHVDNNYFNLMKSNFIHPFILKEGVNENDQPN